VSVGVLAATVLLLSACASSTSTSGSSNREAGLGTAVTGGAFGAGGGLVMPGWDCGTACNWSQGSSDRAAIDAAVMRSKSLSAPGVSNESTPVSNRGEVGQAPFTIDDNVSFAAYVSYRNGFADTGLEESVSVEGRQILQVIDTVGRPVRGASVEIKDAAGALAAQLTTYGDGRVVFNPPAPTGGRTAAYIATVAKGLATTTTALTGDGAVQRITLDVSGEAPTPGPLRVDVMFVLDTTGSMVDELARLQERADDLGRRLAGSADVELRLGLTVYRDHGDEYRSRTFALTPDPAAFAAALRQVAARGGGNTHEDVEAGLRDALVKPGWGDADTVKLLFLIGDAPPHPKEPAAPGPGFVDSARLAASLGITIHTVGATGLDERGQFAFRQLSQTTLGTFSSIGTDVVTIDDVVVRVAAEAVARAVA